MVRKIAAVSEDGKQISSHFGMAPAYLVFSVEGEKILSQEQRAKPHHAVHPHDHGNGGHGEQHIGHEDMFAPISDCQVLLCGGMGEPAYARAQAAGLQVVLVGGDIQDVLQAFLRGQVSSDLRRVHRH